MSSWMGSATLISAVSRRSSIRSAQARETLPFSMVGGPFAHMLPRSGLLMAPTAKEKSRRMTKTVRGEFLPYADILQSIARKVYANEQSRALKKDIELALANRVLESDKLKRRARLLLQSAAWLDMDKFIEHRPPLDAVDFWKKPSPPQRQCSTSMVREAENLC